ncbi:hypothetical protein [Thermoanaerobacter wiegelii]|uniref:Uncharacterized protein n=1 Tax=Thermoanaerobacter wiegelii Rt8.B1 TaxID=697303 RepID=G2MW79_9THEO|nr:hypothetical protein [Thermoanaerobacter wiegelii]AEM78249.1 hypothetical protein Thewi_0815 [Thermoanaerobacter wiegelii Rt8.B1]
MLNNREIAILLWSAGFLIFMLKDKKVRNSFLDVLRTFASKTFIVLFFSMFIWISFIIYILYKVGFWEFSLIKDTIIWIIFIPVPMLFDSTDKAMKEEYFKKKIKENFSFNMVLEFIINRYTFSLICELIIVPIIALLGMVLVIASREEKYSSVEKVTSFILGVSGIFILLNATCLVIKDLKSFVCIETLKSFLLPVILTVLYLPFVYLFVLYLVYEQVYSRLKMKKYIDKELRTYIMKKLFCKFNFKLYDLRKFVTKNITNLTCLDNKKELKTFLKTFRYRKRKKFDCLISSKRKSFFQIVGQALSPLLYFI